MSEQEMDWQAAKGHFDAVRAEYEALQSVQGVDAIFVLGLMFEPLAVRYGRGERSRDLFDAMMAVE